MKKWSKTLLLLFFSVFVSFTVQAQKKTLTILPYTGIPGGDEDAITALLSRQESLHKEFGIMPCSSNFIELAGEIESGDFAHEAEVIAEIKKRLNADFVLMVRADKAGTSSLLLLSLFDTDALRQVAGYYRKYKAVRDILPALPDITQKIIQGPQNQPDLAKLSVLPFYSRVAGNDPDILFQLLNIELTNSGKYAVYPWALVVDNFTKDRRIPYYYGVADQISIDDFGEETDVRYVLTGDILNLGNSNLFMASMLSANATDAAGLYATGNVEYKTIPDSLDDLIQLAKILSGGLGTAKPSPAAKTAPSPAKVSQIPVSSFEFYDAGTPMYDASVYETPASSSPVKIPAAQTSEKSPPALGQALPAGDSKPRMTILPFSSKIGEDEETITILLANQEELRNSFNIIPADTNFDALMNEVGSQHFPSGQAFADELRTRLNVDFALLVRAEKIGSGSIALISLIRMENLQQISGVYQRYGSVREVRSALPDIAKTMTADTGKPINPDLPNLTVLPFYTPSGREIKDANILFQYLTIEVANSGNYTVFPWTLPIETLVGAFKGSYFGIIDPEPIKAFGAAKQIRYVLTGDLLSLGTTNLFISSIVDTQNANTVYDGDLEYRLLMEDMELVSELSDTLLNRKSSPVNPVSEGNALAAAPGSTVDDRWSVPETAQTETAPPPPAEDPFKGFIKIPAGTFIMGTPAAEIGRDSDEIQHSVSINAFYLAQNEVTQAEYEAILGTNPSYFKQYPNLPVEQVNWFEAVAYCNAKSTKEGLNPAYIIYGETVMWDKNANGYRLPTEAEWEYACRAGTTSTFNTGETFTSQDGNFDGTYPYKNATGLYRERTMPVGSFNPNPWGLYDMHGNVYEWCWDTYEPYSAAGTGAGNVNRIVRGGSWYSALRYLRSGNRAQIIAPGERVSYVGFRIARNVPTL
ncbi:MAG: formylglycine-generating enzyme family protein [Spirochaetaceae bacterium]|nr:formylglycine-generating enzyme family protein [Spirochaetaceae bacterium]